MLAVYTAVYGGYDAPKPVPKGSGLYVMYSDRHVDAPGWDVRVDPMADIATPMLRAKYWKTHPAEAVPEADTSVWVDGSLVLYDFFADKCEQALDWHDMGLTPHPLRDCIYDEFEASAGLPKYNADQMRRQVGHYRRWGHPPNWGLFATGCIARRHTELVLNLSHHWWCHNLLWSWQDQLSLPYLLRIHDNVTFDTVLPWAQWWGYHEHGWPVR